MHGLLRSLPFVRFICGQKWCCGVLPATLPAPLSATLSPALWVYLCKCGAAGSASAPTACAICPTLRQSQSRHSQASPLHPGAGLRPSYQSGCVYFLFPWCQSPWLFDSLSVLVVRGGAVCLPTPPSWFPDTKFLTVYYTALFPSESLGHNLHILIIYVDIRYNPNIA